MNLKVFASNHGWKKYKVPPQCQNGKTWDTSVEEMWRYDDDDVVMLCQKQKWKTLSNKSICHIAIKCIDQYILIQDELKSAIHSSDPAYYQKVDVLRKIGRWRRVAIEIFPSKADLVEGTGIYHIWEFKNKNKIPYYHCSLDGIVPFFEESIEIDKMNFYYGTMQVNQYISVLFLCNENGYELYWEQKQRLKNEIYGEDFTAFEVISKDHIDKEFSYTCLWVLNFGHDLNFGLTKRAAN